MKRICALLLTAALLTGPAAAAGETAEAGTALLYSKPGRRERGIFPPVRAVL